MAQQRLAELKRVQQEEQRELVLAQRAQKEILDAELKDREATKRMMAKTAALGAMEAERKEQERIRLAAQERKEMFEQMNAARANQEKLEAGQWAGGRRVGAK